jgi:hypothetical protein
VAVAAAGDAAGPTVGFAVEPADAQPATAREKATRQLMSKKNRRKSG